ncbi:MAG: flagellar basal body rod protein FlgB [Alphaproteobacteria bacterium]|nr:flagellar basal body rod protein FlgB [Alphaproteobacteria bacterium]
MNYTDLPLFQIMRGKLGHLSQRQAVLAQNIANADTPGYKAKDVKEQDFAAIASRMHQAASMPMAKTNAGHLSGQPVSVGSNKFIKRESTYEQNPNGNNVVIEEEMMRVAENQAEYQKVLNLYRKSVDMFRTALGRQGGGA